MTRAETGVAPAPPRAGPGLPWVGSGPSLLRDPTGYLTSARARRGDTFLVEAFGYRLLCVFSPEGVRRLYELPEREASFGLATYELIRHKLPDEVFDGRRNHPAGLFANRDVTRYLAELERAADLELARLGSAGRIEVFAEMKLLGHRLGLASWAGPEAAAAPHVEPLIAAFEALDSSDAFVRPTQAFRTRLTGKRREQAAMHAVEAEIGAILAGRGGAEPPDHLTELWASYADLDEADRRIAVARDLILIHLGSQSNLYAALAWTLVNLLLRPDLLHAVREGDEELLDRVAYESIRLAQRSITLRQVLRPIEVDDGTTTYRIEPGVFLTTMLSVTNTTAAPGLDRFDPAHYDGRQLTADVDLATKELVSTFGHGSHSCPAQRFSILAIRTAVRRLLSAYELTPEFTSAEPRRRQIGGVARSERPCWVGYRAR